MIKLIKENSEWYEQDILFTDSATDVVNLILNKPNIYRVVYDTDYDVYAICNARLYIHDNLAELLFSSGYIQQFMSDEEIESIKHYPRVPVGTDAQRYRMRGLVEHILEYFIFVPYDKNNAENKLDAWYRYGIPITSGKIYVHNEDDMSSDGIFMDIYNKLKRTNNLLY